MKHINTLIIGASAAGLGLADRLGEDCMVIDRGWSAGQEFCDAMRNDPVPMTRELSPYAADFRGELLRREILTADGRLHVLALGGVMSARYLDTGCSLLLGASVTKIEQTDDGFKVGIFEVQNGRRTVMAHRIIDTTVHPFMNCTRVFSLMLCGNASLAEGKMDGAVLVRGRFEDEFTARFHVPRDSDIPAAEKIADTWLHAHPECKAASISLKFAHIFAAPIDIVRHGVRHLVSDSFEDVIAAVNGGAECRL